MAAMEGKLCMVTGATSGIGFCTALELASMGASVVIIGRNEAKCQATVDRIRNECSSSSVSFYVADLSSQAQIRQLSQKFHEQFDHLDVLVNNAGGFFLFRKLSAEGIEMTFALNHLAYFLLTGLLIDMLRISPAARVINVSSGSHWNKKLDFKDIQMAKFYDPIQAYGRSKLANILFTNELSRRLAGTRITANSMTPGIVATDIWKKVHPLLTPILFPVIKLLGNTPEEGAQTSIYLTTSPDVSGISGKYFVDMREVKPDPTTYNAQIAHQLWQKSAELVGISEFL